MNKPDVSIVVLVYNHERFLKKALNSILMQETRYRYEVIIGEDCSSDSSRSIIKDFEPLFHNCMIPIYRDKNLGMVRNMIDCLKRCNGRYIAFLEGDDNWEDNKKLEKQISYMDKNPDVLLTTHNWMTKDKNDNLIQYGMDPSIFEEREYTLKNYENFELPGQTATWMIRNRLEEFTKKYYKKLIPYLWIPGDTLTLAVILKEGKVQQLPDCMSTYHYYIEDNGTNWSSKHDIAAKNNYLYFYMMTYGCERACKKIGLNISMRNQRVKTCKEVRYRYSIEGGRRKKLYFQLQTILMVLFTVKKKQFIFEVKHYGKNKKAD